MKKALAILAATAVLAAGCSATADEAPEPEKQSLSGTFLVPGTPPTSSSGAYKGGRCEGVDGYDDFTEGMQISLLDDAGKTLSVATFPMGKFREDGSKMDIQKAGCIFEFEFDDFTPIESGYYTVDMGRRGEVKYSPDELVSPLELSIGY